MNKVSETDRILIALTSLALNAPSTYTIAWSKGDPTKIQHYPVLYAGIGSSFATVLGAIFGHTKWGSYMMWGGMLATFALFGYVVFIYQPKTNDAGVGEPVMINGKASKMILVDDTEILLV